MCKCRIFRNISRAYTPPVASRSSRSCSVAVGARPPHRRAAPGAMLHRAAHHRDPPRADHLDDAKVAPAGRATHPPGPPSRRSARPCYPAPHRRSRRDRCDTICMISERVSAVVVTRINASSRDHHRPVADVLHPGHIHHFAQLFDHLVDHALVAIHDKGHAADARRLAVAHLQTVDIEIAPAQSSRRPD